MRLIDADALEKEIYKWMPKDQETWMDNDIPPIENLVVSIMMTIQEQPTVDAVPVVRCRECKYSDTLADTTTETMPLKCLNIRYGGVYPDWYCEHGERKDGAE